MEENDIRNALLAELIDGMHERLANKMYPPDPSLDDQPAVTGITGAGHTAEGVVIPVDKDYPAAKDEKSIDVDKDEDEPSDDELEEMMKSM